MNINPVVNIPSNVIFVLKYSLPLVAFFGLFFAGLKDAPVEIIMMLGLFFTALESSLIPYDIGKTIEDEVHPYKFGVKASIFYKYFMITSFHSMLIPLEIRYYTRNGLRLAKFFQALPILLFVVVILLPLFLILNTL